MAKKSFKHSFAKCWSSWLDLRRISKSVTKSWIEQVGNKHSCVSVMAISCSLNRWLQGFWWWWWSWGQERLRRSWREQRTRLSVVAFHDRGECGEHNWLWDLPKWRANDKEYRFIFGDFFGAIFLNWIFKCEIITIKV